MAKQSVILTGVDFFGSTGLLDGTYLVGDGAGVVHLWMWAF